jgi:SAM-dependent methyltransferase
VDPAPRTLDHFPAAAFDRIDPRPDATFYDFPRLVVHIDDGAIAAVGALVRRLAPPGARVLDLMSSYRSHLPADVPLGDVLGIGLNAEELAANPQLTRWLIHDLNADPALPEPDATFDLALCTVSVQYLVRPLEVFAKVRRLLRADGAFLVTFSNRCFPTKATRIWHEGDAAAHLTLVRRYFTLSGGWGPPEAAAHTPPDGDPLYGVWGRRTEGA